METLAPSFRLTQAVRFALESGESVRHGILSYLEQAGDSWSPQVRAWCLLMERGSDPAEFLAQEKSPLRRHLLILLGRGLAGESILPTLISLEEELRDQ